MSDFNKKPDQQRQNIPSASNPNQNKGAPQQGNKGTAQPGLNTNKPNMGGAANSYDRNNKK